MNKATSDKPWLLSEEGQKHLTEIMKELISRPPLENTPAIKTKEDAMQALTKFYKECYPDRTIIQGSGWLDIVNKIPDFKRALYKNSFFPVNWRDSSDEL